MTAQSKFPVGMPPDLLARVDAAARASAMNRSAWIRAAALAALERQGTQLAITVPHQRGAE